MGKNSFRGRPDAIDEDILNYVRSAPNGATVSEIRKAACPRERMNLVRYRIDTLDAAGMIQVDRSFGRVVVAPIADTRHAQECGVDV